MKRLVTGLIALAVLLTIGTPVHASPDDFRFSSFDADYYLGNDSDGRSTLKAVERLTAEFPSGDQNHGIERAIPKDYDGHPTSLRLQSVTDGAGKAVAYDTYESGGNLVVRIGDADAYVHGTTVYVLTYTQRDVTKTYGDTKRNEFYWDINGTLWKQPFGSVTARVHVADSLLPTLTDDLACYYGPEGSNTRCDISRNGNVVSANTGNLDAGENMTVVLGFTLGTFRGYEPSLWDRVFAIWIVLLIIGSIVGVLAIIWLAVRYSRLSNRTKDQGPVATEYVPPKGVSVLLASQIGDGTRADTTAQLIDLAVRHYLTITQTKEKTIWRQAEYDITIAKPLMHLSPEEMTFVETLFGGTAVGTTLQTKTLSSNYKITSKLRTDAGALTKKIKGEYEYRQKDQSVSRSFNKIGAWLAGAGVLTVSPLLLIAGVVAFGCAATIRPLTDKGLELRRYLAGLKSYIELAEKDRIAALQSPEAAARTGVAIGGDGDKKLITLYERTLPYAVLFGQEKEWTTQLAVRYEAAGMEPSWYAGQGAFNAAVFTSAMNDFSGSMNSYGASSSSSSGGSTGGGSSGGGGGGGGGGGW